MPFVVLTHFPRFAQVSGKLLQRYSPRLEEELKQELTKHFNEIFGTKCLLLKLTTGLSLPAVDKKTIPDDFALNLSNPQEPQLILIEYELSVHDVYEHISTQIMKFLDAIPKNQTKLFETLREGCPSQKEQLQLHDAIYKNSPVILMIIDNVTEEIKNAAKRFEVRLLEFASYVENQQDGFDSEHVHFFERYAMEEETVAFMDLESYIKSKSPKEDIEKAFRKLTESIEVLGNIIKKIRTRNRVAFQTRNKDIAVIELKKTMIIVHLNLGQGAPEEKNLTAIEGHPNHYHYFIRNLNDVERATELCKKVYKKFFTC